MIYRQSYIASVLIMSVVLLGAIAAAQDAADQNQVHGHLRTINTAEYAYAGMYKAGFSPTLKALSGPEKGAQYSAAAAGLIDDSIGSGKVSNYVLTYRPGAADSSGKVLTYTVSARPLKWQKGVRSYFTDETAMIASTEEDRPANTKDREK